MIRSYQHLQRARTLHWDDLQVSRGLPRTERGMIFSAIKMIDWIEWKSWFLWPIYIYDPIGFNDSLDYHDNYRRQRSFSTMHTHVISALTKINKSKHKNIFTLNTVILAKIYELTPNLTLILVIKCWSIEATRVQKIDTIVFICFFIIIQKSRVHFSIQHYRII